MQLNCGIVGLPNVGKTSIFSALTSTPMDIQNYPFSTTDSNVGIVIVPDERLKRISEIIVPKKIIYTTVEFVDISGLVRGSSKGEGLGNQFLGKIRQVGVIIHVVRCFDDDNIIHVEGSVDPIRDIETIELELALADMESVQKRLDNLGKSLRSSDKKVSEKAKLMEPILHDLLNVLNEGKPARSLNLTEEQASLVADLFLITMKKQIYCCNVDEKGAFEENDYVKKVKEYAKTNGSEVVSICGKLEADLAEFETPEEKLEFLQAAGLKESGLDKLIRAGYNALELQTYFTAGEKENRAWTFYKNSLAPQAAGVIHSDFERGFIRAEVYHCEDLFQYGSEHKVKEAGKMRLEGKTYVVKDGDVMHFRFNV